MKPWAIAIFLHLGLLGFLIGLPQFGKIESLPQDSGGIPAFLAGSRTQVQSAALSHQSAKPGSVNGASQSGNNKMLGIDQTASQKLAPQAIQALLNVIDRAVQSHLVYPDLAQVHIEQGSILLAFDLAPNGQISGISIEKSSGEADLDRAAIKAVEESSPIDMPVHLNQSIHLSLPVNFSLE